jgi:dTDP-4-dehydrorhamnose reductase
MFSDSYRSSLSFDTVASLTIKLIENYTSDMPLTMNVSGDDAFSKYDVGVLLARKYGISKKLIIPVKVKEADYIFKARRAQTTLLDNSLIKNILQLNEIKLHF